MGMLSSRLGPAIRHLHPSRLGLGLGLGLVLGAGAGAEPGLGSLRPSPSPTLVEAASPGVPRPLDARARHWVVAWIRRVLAADAPPGADPGPGPVQVDHPGRELVVVSVFLEPGEKPRSFAGWGESLREAVSRAVAGMASGLPGLLGATTASRSRLAVERLGAMRRLGSLEPAGFPADGFVPGEMGLLAIGRERQTLLLPWELARQGLAPATGLDVPAIARKFAAELGASEGATIFAFRSDSFLETRSGGTIQFSGLFPDPGDLTPARLDRALDLAGRHLANVQSPAGDFVYQHESASGELLGGDNRVRQAAAIMTAIELSELLPTSHPVRAAARRGVAHLVRSLEPVRVGSDRTLALPPADRSGGPSLGAVALYAQALALAPRVGMTADPVRRALAGLGEGLAFFQRPDGSWYPDLRSAAAGEPPLAKPPFYPGEALLALTGLARRDRSGPWARLARRSALRELRDLSDGLPIDHWTLQGLADYALLTDDESVAHRIVPLALEWISRQIPATGGFAPEGGAVSPCHTGSVGEALRAVRTVAWRFGLDPRPFDRSLVRLGRYLVAHQFQPGMAPMLARPRISVGGFPWTASDWRQRIDVDGHVLRALIGTREAIHGIHPLPLLADQAEALASDPQLRGL